MKPIRVKYLVEDCDRHGNVRIYVRKPGQPKVRIRELLGSPAFLIAYQKALEGTPSRAAADAGEARPHRLQIGAPGSLRWLCVRYYASAEFKRLGARTRYVRKGLIDRICERDGAKPYRLLEPRHVRARRDGLADRPEAANAYIKALRQVFKFAIDAELAHGNPARDVPYLRSGSDGFHTWTIDEVSRFEARHPIGSKARLAMALLLFTGVRRSDAVRLGPPMMRDGWLSFTEAKGQSRKVKERSIPIIPELQVAIDAAPSGHPTFLVTAFGKPFTSNGFGNWFRRRCNEAGLTHCSAHGLRKAGATIAADNGATEHQLMAIYGWDSPKQAALYTRRANRKKLAGDAMHLIVPRHSSTPAPRPSKSVPLFSAVPPGGTILRSKPLKNKKREDEMVPRGALQ